jgi:MFS family permease
MYLSAPVIFAVLTRWPRLRRPAIVVGLCTMCAALAASSFAQEVWQLVLMQGVVYAVGGGLAYSPTILFVNEWFVRRKGLAFGIMWVSCGRFFFVLWGRLDLVVDCDSFHVQGLQSLEKCESLLFDRLEPVLQELCSHW